mgnify:FL=1
MRSGYEGGDVVNRQQRRQAAKHKGTGQNYADVLAKRQIGKETLRMAMEDQAVALAADIICQRQLWGAVIALNEVFQFGPKRTRQFLEAMESVTDDFEAMRKEHGDDYAEEKLRHRAEQVSGIKIRYQHEAERDAWEKMKDEGESDDARDHEDAARPAEQSDR